MTQSQFTEKLFNKYKIEYTCAGGDFIGTRNGITWRLNETCSWDNCYQLEYDGYRANRISIKTAIKKILAL